MTISKLRLAAIKALGSKCVRCGESNILILDIDHIKGDGGFKRKLKGYYRILKEIVAGLNLENYQILCKNCHRIKTLENNDHVPYLNSLDKVFDNVNENLKRESWEDRVKKEAIASYLRRRKISRGRKRTPAEVEADYNRKEKEFAEWMTKFLNDRANTTVN